MLEEKDKAGCLTLARCAATFQNILEDIHIEDRMCEEFHGTFRQGIELNNLRMSEQIPSIQEQIDKEYQPFSIIANLILSYCRTGNINNPAAHRKNTGGIGNAWRGFRCRCPGRSSRG